MTASHLTLKCLAAHDAPDVTVTLDADPPWPVAELNTTTFQPVNLPCLEILRFSGTTAPLFVQLYAWAPILHTVEVSFDDGAPSQPERNTHLTTALENIPSQVQTVVLGSLYSKKDALAFITTLNTRLATPWKACAR